VLLAHDFRPPTLDDARDVIAVLRTRDITDIGVPDFKLEDLRDASEPERGCCSGASSAS
jgi:hypothetical protein